MSDNNKAAVYDCARVASVASLEAADLIWENGVEVARVLVETILRGGSALTLSAKKDLAQCCAYFN